jgi:hypothetical protein
MFALALLYARHTTHTRRVHTYTNIHPYMGIQPKEFQSEFADAQDMWIADGLLAPS